MFQVDIFLEAMKKAYKHLEVTIKIIVFLANGTASFLLLCFPWSFDHVSYFPRSICVVTTFLIYKYRVLLPWWSANQASSSLEEYFFKRVLVSCCL